MTERTTLSDLRYARSALLAIIRETDDGDGYELRRSVRKLAQTALQETDELAVPFHRAGGECVCPGCFSKYREHPLDRRPEARGDQDQPFLRVLCSGERVKL